jgi:hypothetical protein
MTHVLHNKALWLVAIVGLLIAGQSLAITGSTAPLNRSTFSEGYNTNAMFDGSTTTNATSSAMSAYAVKKATAYFERYGEAGNNSTTTFSIQVSHDGTNWITANKLITNAANSNAQTLTRVGSVTIGGATSTSMVAIDLERDVFRFIRCIAAFDGSEATDAARCNISFIE